MTDLTISIPDELMERLRPHLKEMTRVLELGVERIEQIAPTQRDQLAKQYEELAMMWDELREDIA